MLLQKLATFLKNKMLENILDILAMWFLLRLLNFAVVTEKQPEIIDLNKWEWEYSNKTIMDIEFLI